MSTVDVIGTGSNARLEKLLEGPLRRRSTRTGPRPGLSEQSIVTSKQRRSVSSKHDIFNQPNKRKSVQVLRSIRDNDNRLIRKTSIAPDQSFICEETILEDLCEISGLEAKGAGNRGIILREQKMDLLRRLSRNPETADVFSNERNFRRFSEKAMNAPGPFRSSVNESDEGNARRRSTRTEVGPRRSVGARQPRQSQLGMAQSMEIVSSIESNGKTLQKVRRQSVKTAANQPGDKTHFVSTQCNYRTEMAAMKMASEKEKCSCIRGILHHMNIFI